jgi:hypothetical protein
VHFQVAQSAPVLVQLLEPQRAWDQEPVRLLEEA